jgi:SAM-dependent methyltransferase
MIPTPFSFTRWQANRARAEASFLHERVCADLAERVGAVNRRFGRGLLLGAPEAMQRALGASIDGLVRADCAPGFGADLLCSPEQAPFADGAFDLIVSPLFLHWTNDLPGALIQLRRALKPDGLLLAAVFGGETLVELRACLIEAEIAHRGGAGARVAPFADAREFAGLLQRAGFALPVADVDRYAVRYGDPFALLTDLRTMGERSALAAPAPPLTRAILFDAMQRYREHFADPDGRVRATFDVITLTGWAPAPGQPQPLRPGSARARLADALGVREESAGEKAGPKS